MSFYCEPCKRYVPSGQCIDCSTLNGAAVLLNDCNNQNLTQAAIQTNEIAAVHIPAAAARPEAPRLTIPSHSAAHSTRVNKTPQVKPGFLPITSIPHSILAQRAYDPVRNNDNLLLWREAYGNARSRVTENAMLNKSRQKTPASDDLPREETSPIFRSRALQTIQARMQPPPPPTNIISSSSSASSNVQTNDNRSLWKGAYEAALSKVLRNAELDNSRQKTPASDGPPREKTSPIFRSQALETIQTRMQPPPPPTNIISSSSSASSNVQTIVHPIHYDPSNLPNAMNQTERTGSEERAPTLTVSSVSSDKICQMVGYAAARIAANQEGITKEELSLPSDNLLEDGRFNLGQACRRTVQNVNAAMQPLPPPANTMSSSSSASSNVRKRSRDNSSASNPQPTKKVSFRGPGPDALSSPAANLPMTVDSSLKDPLIHHPLAPAIREYIEQRNQNDSAEARSSNAAMLLSKIKDYRRQPGHYLYQFFQLNMNPLDELDVATCMNNDEKNDIVQTLHTLQRQVREELSFIKNGEIRSLVQGTPEYTERMDYMDDLLKNLSAKKSSFAQGQMGSERSDILLNLYYQEILITYGKSLDVDRKALFDLLNKKEKIVYMFMNDKNFNRLEFLQRLGTLGIDIERDFCSCLRKDRLALFNTSINQFRALIAPLSTNINQSRKPIAPPLNTKRRPLPFPLSSPLPFSLSPSSFSSSSSSQQQQRETRQSDDPLLLSLFPELAGLPSP